jgi:hypothetical protein
MKLHWRWCFSCLILFLSACTSLQMMARPIDSPKDNESLVLIRVIPPSAEIELKEGHLINGIWRPQSLGRSYAVHSENGIALFRLPVGPSFAVYRVSLSDTDNGVTSEFRPCNGLKALVFENTVSGYLYIGDILAKMNTPSLTVQYLKDLKDVRQHPEEIGIVDGQTWLDHPFVLIPSMQACVDTVPEAVKTSRKVRKYR